MPEVGLTSSAPAPAENTTATNESPSEPSGNSGGRPDGPHTHEIIRRGNGSLLYNFSDENVVSGAYRLESPVAGLGSRSDSLACFDAHVAPVFEDLHTSFATTHNSEIVAADRRRLLIGYRDMLRCFYPCLSVQDAQFMMECSGAKAFIRNINTASSTPIDLNPLASMGCSIDTLLAGFDRHEFTASRTVNGSCQELQETAAGPMSVGEYALFRGLDIAVLLDNSGSMATNGPNFARSMFPRFIDLTRNLLQDSFLILMSQNDLPLTPEAQMQQQQYLRYYQNYAPYRPYVINTRDSNYRRFSQDYVAQLYSRNDGDGNERHMLAAHEVLSTHMRHDADLVLMIVTDEDDSSTTNYGIPPIQVSEFTQSLQRLTSGRIEIILVHPGQDRSYVQYPILDSLAQQPGVHVSLADLTDFQANGQAQTVISNVLGEFIHPSNSAWFPLRLRENIGSVDHIVVNGTTLAPSSYRVAGPRLIEFSPNAVNPRVPTQVVVHFYGENVRNVNSIRREWMENFLAGLNSMHMDPAHIPAPSATQREHTQAFQEREAQAQTRAQHAQTLLEAYRHGDAQLTTATFNALMLQWNQSNAKDLGVMLTTLSAADLRRLRAGGGAPWSRTLSWLDYNFPAMALSSPSTRPAAGARRAAPRAPSMTRLACLSQVRATSESFERSLAAQQVTDSSVTTFFNALKDVMNQKITHRLLDCEVDGTVPQTTARNNATARTAGTTPAAPAHAVTPSAAATPPAPSATPEPAGQ